MPSKILGQLESRYPYGFNEYLIKFKNAQGEFISALPYETDDTFYLVKIENHGNFHLIDEDDLIDDYDELSEAEELDLDEPEI